MPEQDARNGNFTAQIKLAENYFNAGNYEEAFKWNKKAAENENGERERRAEAQFDMAEHYKFALGVKQSGADAAYWYKQAAENGHRGAQCLLGLANNQEADAEEYDKAAFKWQLAAAGQGDVNCMEIAGGVYYLGKYGIKRDEAEAKKWFKRGADAGNENCERMLNMLGWR